VVDAIHRQLPPGSDPAALVFTGPGGGPGGHGGAGVPRAPAPCCRATTSAAPTTPPLTKLADPTGALRPTAARVLKALRAGGPQTTDQLTAALAGRGRAVRPATVQAALGELAAAGLVADVGEDAERRWRALPTARDPLLAAVDLRGAHDLRHTFATWLEDAGIPARVIDELMGHQAGRRGERDGSMIGTRYRHMTAAMQARVVAVIGDRLAVALAAMPQVCPKAGTAEETTG
jgi:hypothetical protein